MKLLLLLLLLCSGLWAQDSASLRAAQIATSLDDNALAAQVLMTAVDGRGSLGPGMRPLLERIPAGAVMLFGFNLNSTVEETKNLISEARDYIERSSGVPPFIAVDHEGGLVHRFGAGVERLPSAYSFWQMTQREGRSAALTHAETLYFRSAREIRDLGITMVLAPIVEILDEDNTAFLSTRSYGPDPDFVIDAASVFIKGMQSAGIASVLKHFPGNSSADPHYAFSALSAPRETLDLMVRPFAEIINNLDPPVVMMSHVMVPALDPNRNASLSPIVIQDWLRGELNFKGIVLADDYIMDAIAGTGLTPATAAIEALNSGVDMIMVWPRDIAGVHASILAALGDGRLSRERLLEANERIIAEKLRFNLISPREGF
ncbi:MAG: glycoside hydrolase family 3 protein [Treponema sp.]|nr:glycoside hydrolase family 3 protein [Treponema sp.]